VPTVNSQTLGVAGAGAPLAEYLLSQIAPPGAFFNVALVATVFVIGKVKNHQKGACGGDTMIKILYPIERPGRENSHIGKSKTYHQEAVNNAEKLLLLQDESENKPRKMLLMLEEHVRKLEVEEGNRLRENARINNPVTGRSGPSVVQEVKPEENTGEKTP